MREKKPRGPLQSEWPALPPVALVTSQPTGVDVDRNDLQLVVRRQGTQSEEKEEELLGAGDRQDPSFSLQPILLEDLLALGLSSIQILRFPSPPAPFFPRDAVEPAGGLSGPAPHHAVSMAADSSCTRHIHEEARGKTVKFFVT